MKRLLSLLLSLLLCLPAFAGALSESDTDVSVRILATSDLHGWFMPWDFAMDRESLNGGLTLLSPIIAESRATYDNVILVDNGDTVQANYSEYFIDADENPMLVAMNHLDYEIWNWGNHEYNFNTARRQKLIDAFEGVTMNGNVRWKESGEAYLPATTVIEKDGVRIGFIGMTTPLIVEFEAGRDSLDDVDVTDTLEEVGSAIESLQAEDVDAIVALLHMGRELQNGVEGSGVDQIAEKYPEIDVIIAGHDHVNIPSETVNGVLITAPRAYARVLSAVDLTFEKVEDGYALKDKASDIIAVNTADGVVIDEALDALMAPFKEELSGYVNTPIGELINSDLSKPDKIKGISSIFTETTGILSLFTTAARYYTGADIVALNTDYENAGFPVGPISIKNISQSYSYSGGEVTVYKMTGAQVKTFLEWCADYFNQMHEGDLTISYNPARREGSISSDDVASGVTYTIDLTQPTGSRIKDLALITELNDDKTPKLDADGNAVTTPITDDMELLFGCNSYDMDKVLAEGGPLEGQTLETVFNSVAEWGDDGTVRMLAIRYITEVLGGTVDGDAFNFENWKIYTGVDETSPEYLKAVELINNGTIELPALENGRTNVKSITVEDVK